MDKDRVNGILLGIPADTIGAFWEEVAPMLAEAVRRGDEMSLQDVLNKLLETEMQLWLVLEKPTGKVIAAATTTIVIYPMKKVVRIVHIGGMPGKSILDMDEHLEWIGKWGIMQGATRLEAYCRPGVLRKVAGKGFRKKFEVIELDLRMRMQ